MKIIVVCGAGASSTFVAQRLRRAIDDAQRADTVTAVSQAGLDAVLDGADTLLIGPHLPDADRVAATAAAHGVAAAILPDDIFRERDGARALALATAARRRKEQP